MKLLSPDAPYLLSSIKHFAPFSNASLLLEKANDSTQLLHCTIKAETADRAYWTDYDHFMVEREARALRRAYVYGLIANAWKRLWQRLPGHRTAASDAPCIGL